MTHTTDNPHPVHPTGPLTVGGIPDDDLGRLIQATIPVEHAQAVEHLRAVLPEVDPASITAADAAALINLVHDAAHSDSAFGAAIRAEHEEMTAKRQAEAVQ